MPFVRCTRCDSTDDDVADGQVPVSSQQLMSYSYHDDHQQPVSADSFHRHSLDVASNGFLISINDNDR